MNKYKLVPYLVLSKEDAKLEAMQEDLVKLLQDPSIDVTLKRALYEDLLQRINRFKEDTKKPSSVVSAAGSPAVVTTTEPRAPVPTVSQTSPPFAETDDVQLETDQIEPKTSSSSMDIVTSSSRKKSKKADDDGFVSPRYALKKEKRKRKGPDVTPKSDVSTSRTRTGAEFAGPDENRRIGRVSDWGVTSRQTMSPRTDRRASIVQHPARWK